MIKLIAKLALVSLLALAFFAGSAKLPRATGSSFLSGMTCVDNGCEGGGGMCVRNGATCICVQ